MLILSRKNEESIIINNNIEIKVIAIEEGKVRLGINAPRSIDIFRKEVFDKISEENRMALESKNRLDALKGADLSALKNIKKKSSNEE